MQGEQAGQTQLKQSALYENWQLDAQKPRRQLMSAAVQVSWFSWDCALSLTSLAGREAAAGQFPSVHPEQKVQVRERPELGERRLADWTDIRTAVLKQNRPNLLQMEAAGRWQLEIEVRSLKKDGKMDKVLNTVQHH